VMQKLFPELTCLAFSSSEGNEMPVLPQSILGGSAPHLRTLYFDNVPSLSVQRLLLSANNLVHLALRYIPDPGHHSPEDMANCLSGMTGLEILILHFCPPRSHRLSQVSRQLLPPFTPSVLPALTQLKFQGRSYYLERVVARIDAPQLLELHTSFFDDDIFDVPQLRRFIGHAEMLGTHARATMSYYDNKLRLRLSSEPWTVDSPTLAFGIIYNMSSLTHPPLLSLAQVCKSSFPLISTLEELDIIGALPFKAHRDEMEQRMQWLELLGLFTSLKKLHLCEEVALHIVHALKEVAGERERGMLPTLQNIFIERFQSSEVVRDLVEEFVITRQLSGRHVAVHDWEQLGGKCGGTWGSMTDEFSLPFILSRHI